MNELAGRAVLERKINTLEGERLDMVAHHLFAAVYPSRSSARKAVRREEVAVNGEFWKSDRFIEPGTEIWRLEPEPHRHPVYERTIEVVYEDDQLAIVNKPPGLRVNGNRHRTLEHALPFNLSASSAPDAMLAPRPCHRLDGPTGGLVVCAKTRTAMVSVSRSFQERRVDKLYVALCAGMIEGEGVVETPIDGRSARSRYRVMEQIPSLHTASVSRVHLVPETGRTHQLRIHMTSLGAPILGDVLHPGEESVLRGKGLFLWSVRLGFEHPLGGRLDCRIAEPAKYGSLLRRELRRFRRYHS